MSRVRRIADAKQRDLSLLKSIFLINYIPICKNIITHNIWNKSPTKGVAQLFTFHSQLLTEPKSPTKGVAQLFTFHSTLLTKPNPLSFLLLQRNLRHKIPLLVLGLRLLWVRRIGRGFFHFPWV